MDFRMAFSDSNDFSATSGAESLFPEAPNPDVASLTRLSDNLESMLTKDFAIYSDAKIVMADCREIAVHRCILSARSPFFKSVFSGKEMGVKLELKDLAKEVPISFEALTTVLDYLYTAKLKSFPPGVCVCADEECPHIACRQTVDFLLEVMYAAFVFQIPDLVHVYQRHLLDILDRVVADDILVILSVAHLCVTTCEGLQVRCIKNIVKSDVDVITLEKSLPNHLVNHIVGMRRELGMHNPESITFPDKHVKRLHRALDSDDVELVCMLLKEEPTNLDDACALHYAVAFCDAKTTTKLLDLALADVNHRNSRGLTVLHIAAMRKEPNIVVSLLTKGARPSDLTPDGRKALQIAKRLTSDATYCKCKEEGKASPKDLLCIEVLEQAERRDPVPGEASLSLAMAGDDLRMKLLYLENRVGLANILFPMEAKVAMDIAKVDGTCEFLLGSRNMASSQISTVDLNDAPFKIKEEYQIRLRALSRTVELGKRYFPRCSEVLNKIMDDAEDISELAYLGNDSAEERSLKKQRYMELQDVLSKAFTEDKKENTTNNNNIRSTSIIIPSSSSSSTSTVVGKPNDGKLCYKK